ncbi:uncharacterized protein MONBRDRAFT_23019, partial [Monosiga brevicollis MX1]
LYDKQSMRNLAELEALLEEDEGGVGAPINEEEAPMTAEDVERQLDRRESIRSMRESVRSPSEANIMLGQSLGLDVSAQRSRIQGEVEAFQQRLNDHMATQLLSWQRHKQSVVQTKRFSAIQRNRDKALKKAMLGLSKIEKTIMADFERQVKTQFKAYGRKLKMRDEVTVVEEVKENGFEALIDVEMAMLRGMKLEYQHYLSNKVHSVARDFEMEQLNALRTEVKRKQEEEDAGLRRVIDTQSAYHAANIKRELKSKEAAEELEKRLVNVAVEARRRFNQRIGREEHEMDDFINKTLQLLDEQQQAELDRAAGHFETAIRECSASTNEGYDALDASLQWHQSKPAVYLAAVRQQRWSKIRQELLDK